MTDGITRHVVAIDCGTVRATTEYTIIRFQNVLDANGIDIEQMLQLKKSLEFLV